ncbi:hypothetical protein ABT167_27400 [Streptomyces sp. NPDC001792]|uniref:hypothetical protein n=1 Tax=Streptomyces sp. NPDC001792 TaxID=3154524 RepID=UPI00332ADE05
MHDRIAELAGLRNELATCQNGPRESRREKAAEVQEQIDRVRGELQEQAGVLEKRAEELLANGQDGTAGTAREQARAIREALDADGGDESPKRGGKRNTAAAKPPQTR